MKARDVVRNLAAVVIPAAVFFYVIHLASDHHPRRSSESSPPPSRKKTPNQLSKTQSDLGNQLENLAKQLTTQPATRPAPTYSDSNDIIGVYADPNEVDRIIREMQKALDHHKKAEDSRHKRTAWKYRRR